MITAQAQTFQMNNNWDKTFPQSGKVSHEKVTFCNRFGITLAADLYRPKDGGKAKLPAIAVSGPFGAIKEQASGLYAQRLAEDGFITIAFDPRIKASVCVTLYNLTRVMQKGYFDSMDEDARYRLKQQLAAQRTEEFRKGEILPQGGLPEVAPEDAPDFLKQYIAYYKSTERGYHPRSLNSNMGWNITTQLMRLNQNLWIAADEVRTPVLIVHGEKAHSRYFGEEAYGKLTSGKYAANKAVTHCPGSHPLRPLRRRRRQLHPVGRYNRIFEIKSAITLSIQAQTINDM